MTLYVLSCIDRQDSLQRRMAARRAHLAYVGANHDMVRIAGPIWTTTDGWRARCS